jgi:hypothetical protein
MSLHRKVIKIANPCLPPRFVCGRGVINNEQLAKFPLELVPTTREVLGVTFLFGSDLTMKIHEIPIPTPQSAKEKSFANSGLDLPFRACPDFSERLRGEIGHFESFLITIIAINKESAWKSSPA